MRITRTYNDIHHVDEDFVMITHNEVPSPDEAERTANPPPATHTAQEEHDGPNSDVRFPRVIITIFTIRFYTYYVMYPSLHVWSVVFLRYM